MFNNRVNKELVEIRQKFREYYNSELRGEYSALETKRKTELKMFWFWFVLFSLGAVFYIYCCANGIISKKTYMSKGVMKFCFVYIGVWWYFCYSHILSYKIDTKFSVMDKIMEFWGDFNYSYPNGLISKKYIDKFHLFESFDKQEKDDGFQGIYLNTAIKISEQKLVQVCQGARSEYDKIIFKGVLIALEFDKKAKSGANVYGRDNLWTFLRYNILELFYLALFIFVLTFWYMFFSGVMFFFLFVATFALFCFFGFGKMICHIFNKIVFLDKKKVQLEDVVFSKEWKVYSDDQIEARYVLTPALMERMLAVKKLFHGNRLDFSFLGNNLLIAIHTNKDMFETTSLFKSALDYRKVQEVICQLYSVFSVINVLKLRASGNKNKNKNKKENF